MAENKQEITKIEEQKKPITKSDYYIDLFTNEATNIMTSMGLELKPDVKNSLFNLGLACEKAIKDINTSWENVKKDGLASKLLYYAQLDLNPANNELYIIPYQKGTNDKKEPIYVLNFEESYLGKKKKVKRFSDLIDAIAFVVREEDIYEPNIDLVNGDTLVYKPKPFNTKPVIGAVCYLRYKDETKNRIVEMALEELEKVKEASKQKMFGKESPAWKKWESEMCKKAVLKRALKDIEITVPVEYQQAYMNTEQIDNSNYDLNFEEKKTVVINKDKNIQDAIYDETTVETEAKESIEEVKNEIDYAEFE